MTSIRQSVAGLSILVVILFGLFGFSYPAEAVSHIIPKDIELDGYAWSSNIGWISMNCKTGSAAGGDICGTSNYKVTIQSATGDLIGYAWSSNLGWIKFNGLSSFPTGGGTVAASAQVTGTYPSLNFEGWARACAGTAPGNCSNMTSRTDGWDGWISLRGTGYGISSNAADIVYASSFAWGSNVVGWVSFDTVSLLVPTATITATGCTVPIDQNTCDGRITWDIKNATTPNVVNSTTGVSYSTGVAIGTNVLKPLRLGANVIQARDGASVLNSTSALAACNPTIAEPFAGNCEYKPPVVTITTDRTLVRIGETVMVSWTIVRTAAQVEAPVTCNVYGSGITGPVTASGNSVSTAINNATTFKIICTGEFITAEAETKVQVIPSVEEV